MISQRRPQSARQRRSSHSDVVAWTHPRRSVSPSYHRLPSMQYPCPVPTSFRGKNIQKSISFTLRRLCGRRLEEKLKSFESISIPPKRASPSTSNSVPSLNGWMSNACNTQGSTVPLGRSHRASPRRTDRKLKQCKGPSTEQLELHEEKRTELQKLQAQQEEIQRRISQLSQEMSSSTVQKDTASMLDRRTTNSLDVYEHCKSGKQRPTESDIRIRTTGTSSHVENISEMNDTKSVKPAMIQSFEKMQEERNRNVVKRSRTLQELLTKSKEAYTQRSVTSLRSILSDRSVGESRVADTQRARVWFQSRGHSSHSESSTTHSVESRDSQSSEDEESERNRPNLVSESVRTTINYDTNTSQDNYDTDSSVADNEKSTEQEVIKSSRNWNRTTDENSSFHDDEISFNDAGSIHEERKSSDGAGFNRADGSSSGDDAHVNSSHAVDDDAYLRKANSETESVATDFSKGSSERDHYQSSRVTKSKNISESQSEHENSGHGFKSTNNRLLRYSSDSESDRSAANRTENSDSDW